MLLMTMFAQCPILATLIAGNRSLNLGNAAAIVVYEACRQTGFTVAGEDLMFV